MLYLDTVYQDDNFFHNYVNCDCNNNISYNHFDYDNNNINSF